MLPFLFAVQEASNLPAAAVSAEGRVVRGRLLDALNGTPVVGAACELWSEDFDAPMELQVAAQSGLDGSFVLNDPPRRGEKVRVRAAGYRSTVFAGDDVVFLFPQDEPLTLLVLDLDGQPIAGAHVRSHQTCQHGPAAVEGTSGEDGRVVLADAPPFEDGPEYEVRAPGHGALTQIHWSSLGADPVVYLPRRAAVRLRLLDAEGTPLAHRRFRQQGPGLTAFVTDGEGRAVLDSLFESREIGLEESVKEGPVHLFGWPTLEGECTLQVGSEEFVGGAPRADWPRLRVHVQRRSTLHVQYGADSITHKVESESCEVPVQPGVAVTVLAQRETTHRAVLQPWTGALELDLTSDSTLWPAKPAAAGEVALRFRVVSDGGEDLECRARLRWPGPQREDEDPSPDGVLFRVPRGERFEVGFGAEGHVPRFLQGRANAEDPVDPVPEPIVLRRYAHIEFRGPVERIEVGGQVRTEADGEGWSVLELAPGFARGQVWFANWPWPQTLVRTLGPGETLVLEEPSRRVTPR